MNLQQHLAYIKQRQAEVRAFSAGMREASARDSRTLWMYPLGGLVAGANLFGVGAVFVQLIGT